MTHTNLMIQTTSSKFCFNQTHSKTIYVVSTENSDYQKSAGLASSSLLRRTPLFVTPPPSQVKQTQPTGWDPVILLYPGDDCSVHGAGLNLNSLPAMDPLCHSERSGPCPSTFSAPRVSPSKPPTKALCLPCNQVKYNIFSKFFEFIIFLFVSAVAMQMNKSTMGSLVWRAGMASSMSVSLTRDTPSMHFVSMLQFGIPHSFGFIAYTHKLVDGKVRLGFRFV